MNTNDLQVIRRIEHLFRRWDTGLLSAVDSVYSLKTRRTDIDDSDRWMVHYSISIDALMRWSTFRLHLAQCEIDVVGGRLPSLALARLESLIQEAQMLGFLPPPIEEALWRSLDKSTGSAAQFIQATREFHT